MKIFISLNSDDIKDAKLLVDILRKWGIAGGWTMEGIPGGIVWKKYMIEALNEASVCILSVSKNGVTFTQGYEAGVAFGRGLTVIPVLHTGGEIQHLPDVLRELQFRDIGTLNRNLCVLKSRLIHDLHPLSVAHSARQWIIELVELIVRALDDKRSPKSKNVINGNTAPTVAKATNRQQLAGMVHLTKHGDSTQFLNTFEDQLDERYQKEFNKLVGWLQDRGISDQVILRTCVLADPQALAAWKKIWKL